MTAEGRMMTFQKLRELLSKDIELDLERFGKDGYRPLSKLHEELGANDVWLEFKSNLGRVILFRMSAQGLLKTDDGYALIETERWYPGNRRLWIFRGWRRIRRGKEFSISETMRTGEEDVVSALRRGIAEEWKLHIPEDTFVTKYILDTRHPMRSSTVYPKLLTITHSTLLEFKLPKRPWLWDPITTDDEGGKTMLTFLKWIPPHNEKQSERILRSVLTVLFRFWIVRIRYLF